MGWKGRPQFVADPTVNDHALQSIRRAAGRARLHHLCAAESVHFRGSLSHVAAQGQPAGQDAVLDHRAAARADGRLAGVARFVDPERIAFYGLSYGGKTAMRVPAIVERYCLSICSADFNEWIWKNVSSRSPYSYLHTRRIRDVRVRPGQHVQLCRDGRPDRAAAVHGRARAIATASRPTNGSPTNTPRCVCSTPT